MDNSRINIIVLHQSITDAETLADNLRKHGLIVNSAHIENAESLRNSLQNDEWDLIIYAHQQVNISPQTLFDLIHECHQELPVLVTMEHYTRDIALSYFEMGAIDVLQQDETEVLVDCVLRETGYQELKHKLEKTRQEQFNAEERFYRLAENIQQPAAYVHEGLLVYANTAFMDLFNLEDIEGLSLLELCSRDDRDQLKKVLHSFDFLHPGTSRTKLNFLLPKQRKEPFFFKLSPCCLNGETCIQVLFEPVKATIETVEKTAKPSGEKKDISRLINSELFFQTLKTSIPQTQKAASDHWLCLLELDDIPSIKESIGLAASDAVLQETLHYILSTLKQDIIISSLGGDAFALVLENYNEDQMLAELEKLRLSISNNIIKTGKHAISLTCSMGVCAIDDDQLSVEQLLAYADTARRIARKKGGNLLHIFDPWKDQNALHENIEDDWCLRLESALKYDNFSLLYQPVTSIQGSAVARYEILLRLMANNQFEVMPDQFLHAARKCGMEARIDRWVISHTLDNISKNNPENKPQLFIKLSDQSVLDSNFPDWLTELLNGYGRLNCTLAIEVSSQLVITHEAQLRAFITKLHELDVKIVIEHVSKDKVLLNTLPHIEVDYLKLDGKLVAKLAHDRESQLAIGTISDLAKKMGVESIAASVQDAGSLAVLWQNGINYIQGYYINPPMRSMEYDFSETHENNL